MSSSLSSSLFYNRCGSSGVADHRGREYHVSNFAPFSAAEWKLSRSRRRLSGMDFDAACDRAKEKMADCSRRWSNRFDSDTAAVRQFEQRVNDALVVTSRAASRNAEPPQQTREFGVTRPLSRVPRIFEEQVPPPSDKSKMTPNSWETSDVSLSRSSNTDKTKANGSANIVNGRLKAASGGSDEDKSSKSTHTSRTPRDNDQSRARSLERPLVNGYQSGKSSDRPSDVSRGGPKQDDLKRSFDPSKVFNSHSHSSSNDHDALTRKKNSVPSPVGKGVIPKVRPNSVAGYFPKLNPVMPNVNQKRKSSADHKFDWLESREEERKCIDSLVVTIDKWVDTVSTWELDPLGKCKCEQPLPVSPAARRADPYVGTRGEVYTYEGQTNAFGKPHGSGTMIFDNGDKFTGNFNNEAREGPGSLELCAATAVTSIGGVYRGDRLQGKGNIEYRNGDVLYGWFENGSLHGFSKLFDRSHNLLAVGWYENGKLSGLHWLFLVGGGCLIGEADPLGHMSGSNVTFLFPDHTTAMTGTFSKSEMFLGQVSFIQTVAVRNEMCRVSVTSPRGPLYHRDCHYDGAICDEPLLPDPYESQYCFVRASRIKGAKEGLFARRDMPAGSIVAFYNGVRMRSNALDTDEENYEGNAYKIMDMLGADDAGVEGVLDIPEYFVSIKNYKASLAHKANHSFMPNAKFILFHHPRFGKVPALRTTEEVARDAEIMVSYDYALEDAPPWYQELYAKRIMDKYRMSKTFNGENN